jgi:ferredoxin
MKVHLRRNKCVGHAQCHAADPDLFPINDEGYSTLESRAIALGDEQATRLGVSACPELALTLEDD